MADGEALRVKERIFAAMFALLDFNSWESAIALTSETVLNTYLEIGSTIILCCYGLSCFSVRYFPVFRALISVFNQSNYTMKSNLEKTGNGCFALL